MNRYFWIFSGSFFFANWITLFFNNYSLIQSLNDAFFNTCACTFMVFFIKFNLDLFYDPEEKNDTLLNLKNNNKIITATEKIMIKTKMNDNIVKNVKDIIKR